MRQRKDNSLTGRQSKHNSEDKMTIKIKRRPHDNFSSCKKNLTKDK